MQMLLFRKPWLLMAAVLLFTHSIATADDGLASGYTRPQPHYRGHHSSSLAVQDPTFNFDDKNDHPQQPQTTTQQEQRQRHARLREWPTDQEAQPKRPIFEPQLQGSDAVRAPNSSLHLWYRQPAKHIQKEGFFIGNGKAQVLVGGRINAEQLVFNEQSCWSGGPNQDQEYRGGNVPDEDVSHKQEAFQTIRQALGAEGKSRINPDEPIVKELLGTERGFGQQEPFGEILVEELHPFGSVHNYRRELDLSRGVVNVSFTSGDVTYTREHYCSYPDSVCVMRIQGSEPKSVNVKVSIRTKHAGEYSNLHNRLSFRGHLEANNMTLAAVVTVKTDGASGVSMSNDWQVVALNFDAVTLYYSFATGWTASGYPSFADVDLYDEIANKVDKAAGAWYNDQFLKHVKDHEDLFSAFNLDLGQTDIDMATDELVEAVSKTPNEEYETYLDVLLVQYGRYLLIASSRPGSLPVSGQNIWSTEEDDDKVEIQSRYKMNIELQMNYWLAESTNLGETVAPLIDYMEQLLVLRGEETALQLHSARGWTAHTYSNIWAHTGPTSEATSSYFPGAAAWLCQHAWDHYLYTQDYYFLRDHAYKLMKGASQFWIDTLVPSHIDGLYVSSPSFSPERGPFTEGAALDQQLVHQLFKSTLDAITIVGERDKIFVQNLTTIFANLSSGLAVGNFGQLQEWKSDKDQPWDNHYHLAPLYALYPGYQILDQEPELKNVYLKAAKKTLKYRKTGVSPDNHYGWPKVWRAALWARLGKGSQSYEMLKLFREEHVINANLLTFDELSGLLGYGAAVLELLIQSPMPGRVNILTATEGLPERWLARGSVTDYKTRDSHRITVSWFEGAVQSIEVVAGTKTGAVAFQIGTKGERDVKVFVRGSTKQVEATTDGDTVTFNVAKGTSYEIQLGE